MKKWRCLVCDLIYDEAEGWPDDGIPPGTRWEDVPEDWVCPYCGVGKEDFDMVEIKSSQSSGGASISPELVGDPIVIVGAGMAAYNLAKEFRKKDITTPLKIVSRDDGCQYYKPSLSCGLTDNKAPDDLVMAHDIEADFIPFTGVDSIDRSNRSITLNGEEISYRKLVFATGADVVRARFAGDGVDRIHSVNDLLDYRKFRADLVGKKKVVIIGAGLIGCEFANDLLNKGFQVEVVDTFDQCMPAMLPKAAALALRSGLESLGCEFHFNSKVEAINKDGDHLMVSLSGGKMLEAEVVVSAIGLRPRKELADKAGLETGQGIKVNRYLETSDPDIYALGDCAEIEGNIMMYVEPLLISAKALANTLSGNATSIEFDPMPIIVKTPVCPVVVAAPAQEAEGEWVVEAENNNVKALFRNGDGRNLGFVLTGDCVSQRKELQKTLSGYAAV